MNDLKEFPVVLGCRNCTRCSYYKFVTRVSIETNEIESEPNNISYKLAGTRNDDWGGSSMYPERDGPVRGNIRVRLALFRFDFSFQISNRLIFYHCLFFFFFKSIKTRLLRIFSSKFFLPRSFARVKEKQSQRRRERKKGNEKWMDRNSSEKKTKSNEHEVKL